MAYYDALACTNMLTEMTTLGAAHGQLGHSVHKVTCADRGIDLQANMGTAPSAAVAPAPPTQNWDLG